MINTIISHYKVLEKLGGGGMGVVYKAEDTRLHRTVALKFLPPSFSFDEEAKLRFIREAQAASSLQHNNICNIHDVDETEDERIFICMDFYDGETLKKKIERGPLEIDEAVNIVTQIAEGLRQAHEKGIIHRDIKPANIFITKNGIVKILDFGLAKLAGQTMMTRTGATLGTAAYMSPEQVRGEEVDSRTDIWSIGVIFYEMITGRLPFKGEYEQAIMFAILNQEPESIIILRGDISSGLEHIINVCLEKEKEFRYNSIEVLLSDLEEIDNKQFNYRSFRKNWIQRKLKIKNKNQYYFLAFGTFLILASMLAVIIWPTGHKVKLNPNRTIRTLNLPFKQIMYPSISADGNWIAFPAMDVNTEWNVYLSHSSSGEAPVSLVNDKKQFIWSAEISPDGSYVMYNPNYPWSVKIIPSSGGVPKILDSLKYLSNIQWRPDGRRIGGYLGPYSGFSYNGANIFYSSYPDGNNIKKEFLDTARTQLFRNFGFAWSPDGKSIAWLRDFDEGSGYQEIYTHNLETGEEKQITFAKSNIEALCWSNQNMIIFSATISGALNLWIVPSEGGELTQLTFGDGPDGPPRISNDGRKIIFPKMKMIGQIFTKSITGGETKLITAGEQTIWDPGAKLSPDGTQIAFNAGDLRLGWAGAESYIYIINRDGNHIRKLSAGEWKKKCLDCQCWSTDGKWLAFISERWFDNTDFVDAYIIDINGKNHLKKIISLEKFRDLIWIDSLNLSIRTEKKFYTYSVNQNTITEDTVLYYPTKVKSQLLLQDLSGDWWLIKKNKKHKIKKPEYANLSLSNLCWSVWGPGMPFKTISLLNGKIKEYPKLIGTKLFGKAYLSDDGKEIIFSTQEFIGQISMIENPFVE
jgi:serine/threonine protein kinase